MSKIQKQASGLIASLWIYRQTSQRISPRSNIYDVRTKKKLEWLRKLSKLSLPYSISKAIQLRRKLRATLKSILVECLNSNLRSQFEPRLDKNIPCDIRSVRGQHRGNTNSPNNAKLASKADKSTKHKCIALNRRM